MISRSIAGLALSAGLIATPALAQTHDHGDHAHPVLGEVHFPVSCSPAAQAAFDEGMRLQHSFWYRPAREAFQKALAADPGCTMAYWGQALTLLNNPFTPPVAENLRDGKALLDKAKAMGAKSEREAAYVDALAELFAGDDPSGQPARIERYKQAMAALHKRFPDDSEGAIGYALALVMAASPTDKSYANQLEAALILEREFERQPQHPGVAHYMIHTYDVPALAPKGVAAAERYAKIAADAPHALHMPSHIFTRVGRWESSIETNRRSADTAAARGEASDAIHALDYLAYAYLQTAQPEAALKVREELKRFEGSKLDRPIVGYAFTAIPARYALERGDWEAASRLEVRSYGPPQVDATTHFARALGAARSGRPQEAAADIAALKAAAAALKGKDAYWHEQVEIQRVSAEGWVAFASGRRDEGLALLREAADREARTEKHPVTPGPLAPAREQLAEMLLIAGRHAEAQAEFEAVQQSEPRRLRAVWGAARSAELAGDKPAAERHYAQLVEIAAPTREAKPELIVTKAFLDRR